MAAFSWVWKWVVWNLISSLVPLTWCLGILGIGTSSHQYSHRVYIWKISWVLVKLQYWWANVKILLLAKNQYQKFSLLWSMIYIIYIYTWSLYRIQALCKFLWLGIGSNLVDGDFEMSVTILVRLSERIGCESVWLMWLIYFQTPPWLATLRLFSPYI